MAHRKRSRGIDDIDGDVEIESASSSLRHTHQKRSRIALAQSRGGSVVSDDEDAPDGVAYTQALLDEVLNGEQADPYSDGEDEEEEIDEIRGTQIVQKQLREHRDNIASDQGVIEEVFCRNFMCHSKLRIKLGPLINFIIGHNGSGKSAVLTALTMCLGGKATTTNRAANLKSLIKEGEESASLAVKIKNRGEGAYKPDLFGQSIIVERHFSRSGQSGFKLKNAEDKIISTKKSELDDILDYFGLQLDNPINVLTQDLARQFLHSSTPHDKYKFFIRGTQLETLDTDYKLLEEHLDNMENKVRAREEDIAQLQTKMLAAHEKKKRADQTDVIRKKIDSTMWQHAWTQVADQERRLAVYEDNVEKSKETIHEAEQEAESKSAAYEGHDQSHAAAERQRDDMQAQLEPMNERYQEATNAFKASTQELMNSNASHRQIKAEIKNYQKNCENKNHEIKEEEKRLAAAEGPEGAERMDRLEQFKLEVEEAKQSLQQHEDSLPQLLRDEKDAQGECNAAQPEYDRQKQDLQTAETRLSRLQQSDRGRPFEGYRPNMEKLVKAIGNETRWRVKPVGPMGQHVRLLKPEWSSILEKTFGGVLESFIVSNKDDQSLLSSMMRRVGCDTPIFIGNGNTIDANTPQGNHDTIMSVLTIDSNMVRNQLVINQAIEQIVLIKARNEGAELIKTRPSNVRAVLTMTDIPGDRGGVRFETTRVGATKSSPVHPWNGPARMKTDRQEQIRMEQETLNQAKRHLQAREQELKQKENALNITKQALTRYQRQKRELTTAFQTAQDAVEGQEHQIEEHRPGVGRLQELERQLAAEEESLKLSEAQYIDAANDRVERGAKNAERKHDLDGIRAELDQFEERKRQAGDRVAKLADKRSAALMEKNHSLNMIDKAKRQLAELEEKRDQQGSTVAKYTEQAETFCRRVQTQEGVTIEALDRQLTRLQADLVQREREVGGTREELLAAYAQAKKEFDDANKQIRDLAVLCNFLKKALDHRQHRWKMFRKYITFRARIMFQYLLNERSFRGRVIVDHTNKQLDISVEPDHSKASDAGREARTLSGGEKSFSTICLLLSIWEAMGSPIRCLDEFDVFMDSVNRTKSMGLMIGAARRAVGRQFILITPQSMTNVELGDDVKVHKMSDPERGQTTLPY